MAKRFMKPTINWQELEKLVPPEQKTKYMAFKGKSDAYLQRVMVNPAEMPKIDWEAYKKLIPVPGLVDCFKSELEKYCVPYPKDTLTASIDDQWKKLEIDIKQYCQDHDKDIEAANKELKRIRALPKFEDMTMEMFRDIYPDDALDPVNKPSFWPHNPEEQPGYLTAEQKALKKKGGH
ncbi:ATP synthase subunit d, mitochondrial-like [Battus philenor]|uniref:ATP synthase subunit d, mitochondrial-like n=1 Tax=Battus philenor TaxID=42288 RepID=UPI0035D0FF79